MSECNSISLCPSNLYLPGVGTSHREAQRAEGFLNRRVSWAVQERLCHGGVVSRVEASRAGCDMPHGVAEGHLRGDRRQWCDLPSEPGQRA